MRMMPFLGFGGWECAEIRFNLKKYVHDIAQYGIIFGMFTSIDKCKNTFAPNFVER